MELTWSGWWNSLLEKWCLTSFFFCNKFLATKCYKDYDINEVWIWKFIVRHSLTFRLIFFLDTFSKLYDFVSRKNVQKALSEFLCREFWCVSKKQLIPLLSNLLSFASSLLISSHNLIVRKDKQEWTSELQQQPSKLSIVLNSLSLREKWIKERKKCFMFCGSIAFFLATILVGIFSIPDEKLWKKSWRERTNEEEKVA